MYPQGRMSHHFRELQVGDYLAVRGPKVCVYLHFTIKILSGFGFFLRNKSFGSCKFYQGRFKYQPGEVRAFGMLAGGSGITPMFQVCF